MEDMVQAGNEAHVFMSQALLTFAKNEIVANTKVSCGLMQSVDPTPMEPETPGVGVNPGVTREGGMRVIGVEGTAPVKVRGRNQNN
jgi:hypothetical protein